MEKFKTIKAKAVEELKAQEQALHKEAMNLRFQQAQGALKNTARRRQIRREVARIKTAMAQATASKKENK
jgi:large subunit ribosomal protein L29